MFKSKPKTKSYINKKGYKFVYKPKNPQSSENGFIAEHRLVASKKIKRPLTSDDIVHHKDGDKLNNKKKNLAVITKSEHYKIHVLKK